MGLVFFMVKANMAMLQEELSGSEHTMQKLKNFLPQEVLTKKGQNWISGTTFATLRFF